MAYVTTGLYPFDPYGTNPANLVTNDPLYTLQTPAMDEYLFIIPKAAPFFADSMEVRTAGNNQLLIEGVDYVLGHHFVEAMDSTGRPINGSIRFLNRNLTGQIRLRYRTIGGDWGFSDQAVLEELSNKLLNPLTRSYGDIDVLPYSFPAVPHDQRLDTLIGYDQISDDLISIAEAIEAASEGTSAQHINDKNNPHDVTKAQVGLSLVMNYAVATQQQTLQGTRNDLYTTPYTVKYAIDQLAVIPLNNHIANQNNPHGTNKAHVGLSLVANLALATAANAVDIANNSSYLTPYSATILFNSLGFANRIDDLETLLVNHLNDKQNPHEVTPAQIGAYTRAEVDNLIANVAGGDATRFDGLTGAEWRQSLPSFADMTLTIETIGNNFSTAASEMDATVVTPPATPLYVNVADLILGYQKMSVALMDDTVVEIPTDGVFPIYPRVSGNDTSVAYGDEAYYYVDEDGKIHNHGVNSIEPPTGFRPADPPPAIRARVMHAVDDLLMVLEDGRLFRHGTVNYSNIASDVAEIRINSAYTTTRNILILDTNGRIQALGNSSFTAQVTSVLNPLTNVGEIVFGNNFILVETDDGIGRIYSYNPASHVINLQETVAGPVLHFSGFGDTYVMSTEDNDYHGVGQAYEELDKTNEYSRVECGPGYIATLDVKGNIELWGDTGDAAFTIPTVYKTL